MTKVLLILAIALSTGCASIVSKDRYPISILSNPADCDFTVYNSSKVKIYTGKTPTQITLPASSGYFESATYYLEFEKPGYSDTFEVINSTIDPWYYGNLLYLPFGLVPTLIGGGIIDPLSGDMWELPDFIHIEMNQ